MGQCSPPRRAPPPAPQLLPHAGVREEGLCCRIRPSAFVEGRCLVGRAGGAWVSGWGGGSEEGNVEQAAACGISEALQRTRTARCEIPLRPCSHVFRHLQAPPINNAEVDLVAAGGPAGVGPHGLGIYSEASR